MKVVVISFIVRRWTNRIGAAFYRGFARDSLETNFLISDGSAGNMLLAS